MDTPSSLAVPAEVASPVQGSRLEGAVRAIVRHMRRVVVEGVPRASAEISCDLVRQVERSGDSGRVQQITAELRRQLPVGMEHLLDE